MQLDFLQKDLPADAQESFSSDASEKSADAFKTISEAADFLGVPQHVLRFWESRFKQIKPLKMRGGRRYYRPEDMDVLSAIKQLLYKQGYTIEGAKKALSSHLRSEETPDPHAQLAALRQELITLRNALKPHVF